MSTFTNWNGPDGGSGPSTKSITELANAYAVITAALEVYKRKLDEHILKDIQQDDVHKGQGAITNAVNNLDAVLRGLINATNTGLQTEENRAKGIEAGLQSMINALTPTVNAADTLSKANLQRIQVAEASITALQGATNALDAALKPLADNIVIGQDTIELQKKLKVAIDIWARLNVNKLIDFSTWEEFTAPFAGTGSSVDTGTNGIYILGELSKVWDDTGIADDRAKPKSARAFIKYINSNPINAIVDMTVSYSKDHGYSGAITVLCARHVPGLTNLTFHLLRGTGIDGLTYIYLGVSADELSAGNANATMTFRAAGINFIPGN